MVDEVKYRDCQRTAQHWHAVEVSVEVGGVTYDHVLEARGPFVGPHFWPVTVDGRPIRADDAADGSRDGGQPE